jgi:hypothetical protein
MHFTLLYTKPRQDTPYMYFDVLIIDLGIISGYSIGNLLSVY